ncbi:MAG: O-antigen ligase family protein [Flavobacteriaceae bacterium]|nr:O-antigen ligase family protein [Flavobacteriaceae bacterium]MCI5087795.1 O-antigen ligase family protein [Flavobacteriaceae bacterium]
MPAFKGVDKMAFQWLYLNIVNLIYVVVLIIQNDDKTLATNKSLTSFAAFVLMAIVCGFFALNKTESVIEISRYINLIISFSLALVALSKSKNIELSNMVTYVLLIECLLYYLTLYYYQNTNGTIFLKGIASNINIQAFSIVIKLPWVLFIEKNKKYWIKNVTIWLAVSILFVISSRASLLSLGLISILYLVWQKTSFKEKIRQLIISLVPGILGTVVLLNPILKTGEKLQNISIINESSLTRLSFYKEALNSIISNPLLGIGTGNWKLFSIEAHKELVNGYTIPYHAHNDFLQISAETGIIGGLLYILVFFFAFNHIRNQWNISKNKTILKAITVSLLVYLIDANLNFPISRPMIQVQLILILGLLFSKYPPKTTHSIKLNRGILSAVLVILLGSTFYSFKVYDSFKLQKFLLEDFGSQKFDTELELIESIDYNTPNIGATALPIKAMIANYYSQDSLVTSLLDQAIKDNPFIKYPQTLKSIRYRTAGNIDSALVYAKEAFYGLPKNELHIVNYFSVLSLLKDSLEIDKVYEKIKTMNSKNVANAYLLSQVSIGRSMNKKLERVTNEAIKLYPEEEKFKLYKLRLLNGDSILRIANNLFEEATADFEAGNFKKSAHSYLEASKILPEDPAYLENAGHAYYLNNQNNKALSMFDSVINHYSNGTGKAEYLKGLMLYETKGVVNEACDLFQRAIRKGNEDAKKAQNLLCK